MIIKKKMPSITTFITQRIEFWIIYSPCVLDWLWLRSKLLSLIQMSLLYVAGSREVSWLEEVLLVQAHKQPIVFSSHHFVTVTPERLDSRHIRSFQKWHFAQEILTSWCMNGVLLLCFIWLCHVPCASNPILVAPPSASASHDKCVVVWNDHFPLFNRLYGEITSASNEFGMFPCHKDTPCSISKNCYIKNITYWSLR